jgi:hypothetical protein
MNSAMQVQAVEKCGNGKEEEMINNTKKKNDSIRTFKRIPKSKKRSEDNMQIDVKKRPFLSNKGALFDVAKRMRMEEQVVGEVTRNPLNVRLFEQPCEKKRR